MTQDRYEALGAPNTPADDLTKTPVGIKGTPIGGPYAPGQNGRDTAGRGCATGPLPHHHGRSGAAVVGSIYGNRGPVRRSR